MSRVVRVAVKPLECGETSLDAGASHYLLRVQRLRTGASFVAFDPLARTEADAVLLDERTGGAHCRISELRPARHLAPLSVTLLQGIGKGDKPDRVVRDATALGAARIVFVETERGVVKLGERAAARLARWQKIAVDAARQSGRGDLPELSGTLPLEQALERYAAGLRLCLDPGSALSLASALAAAELDASLLVLIGPEGGFTDAELCRAERAGFVRVGLGRFTLRTETAAVAALGTLMARYAASDAGE